ncbi:porin [Paraburkholderia caballeronis]|uniref:Outer membrane protein (Porin) n=1 Tax=Paraburkholderia caballeronis TaxID=416943 RepID=A0A1H7RTX6_9BURK|nr:porin [Paraburkholderia caballeronis]PXW23209.1 putative porin [Paraburkholderia caballeronis]PXW97873.1 putative porin [Paraburkholderia caballeronis]RAJ94843.1 putative porin [Paraburkholderia caballeronis]TDV11652.1 putative porin [Paraburkholderia caballeronis]TDV14733.1 putative porin [Paraburkholderia caballeronis]
MKKTLWSAAGLACVSITAHAQSSVTLYGLIDASIQYTSNQGGGRTWAMASGTTRGSRFGLLGSEDLGGGSRAIFRLENGFDVTDGSLGQGGLMFGRQAYVGLENDRYGKITLGRQYESMVDYIAQLTAADWSVYMEHPGDMDLTNRGVRVDNSVRYANSYGGFTGSALYSFGGQPGSFGRDSMWSLGGSYADGPLYVGFGMTYARQPGDRTQGTFWKATNSAVGSYALAAHSFLTVGGGASYTFGPAKLSADITSAQYKDGFEGQDVHFMNYEVNGVYFFTPALSAGLGVTYTDGQVDATNADPRYLQYNAMLTYSLSKRTQVYAFGTFQRALRDAPFAQVTQFISASSGQKQGALGIGLRQSF